MPTDAHIALRQQVYQAGGDYHAAALGYWTEGRDALQADKVRLKAATYHSALAALRVFLSPRPW